MLLGNDKSEKHLSSAMTPKMRMGTRTSMSALHRERLRLTTTTTTNEGSRRGKGAATVIPPLHAAKKPSLDLDYQAMEVKSILPLSSNAVRSDSAESLYEDAHNDSLNDSLLERLDALDPVTKEEEGEYAYMGTERRIVSVTVAKDSAGRLGLKITGTPGGIYVDGVDRSAVVVQGQLKLGDRLIAVNGRSLENVTYAAALDLIKSSDKHVNFLVSQIKTA